MELKLLPIIFIFFLIPAFAQAQVNFDTSPYKIALSFDGNAHDADDIVAAPMSLAIIAEAGLKDRVVHVDYSNHIWNDQGSNNDEVGDQALAMREAMQGTINYWNYGNDIFFEVRIASELIAARSNFVNKTAEVYNAGEQLYYLLGGPMEVPYQCITQVPNYQRNNITAVSHSYWNEDHVHGNSNTWAQLKETGVRTVKIADQNTYDCSGCPTDDDLSTPQFDKWQWLADMGGKFKWLYDQNPFTTKFDASDAGMAWWVITGRPSVNSDSTEVNIRFDNNKDIYATPAKIEELFKSGGDDGGENPPDNTEYVAIPAQIEAEDYSSQSGVKEENTTDTGGGVNIGFINGGDWMEYKVDATTAGNYEIVFRIAAARNGGKIEISKDNTLLSIVNVPVTGGWQEWSTVSIIADLSEGTQTLHLNFVGSSDYLFNINWINFSTTSEEPPAPPVPTKYFYIVNKLSGKKIRPLNDSEDAPIVQAPATLDDDILQWEQITTDEGYFYLKNKATGNYFRPDDRKDFAKVIQKPTSYEGNWTQWKKVDSGDGYFHLSNRGTGKNIRVKSTDDITSGTDYFVEQAPKSWTKDWVRWQFVEVNTGARLANKQESKPFSANENLSPVEEIIDETADIKVYPNPATTYLNISGITPDTQMEIFDLRGNILIGISGQNNINVSALPAGMYLINIDGKTMQRFIKE